mgnify:FL=1
MAELADALDSGSNDRKVVEVQVLLPAPLTAHIYLDVSIFCLSETEKFMYFQCF